ncbi:hypothetical protein BDD12DRAFT_809249 [Trichophaea hybrida]|nr:hypothetical protein BDD12DRAFT_809249 [Trichophaea hybrida]
MEDSSLNSQQHLAEANALLRRINAFNAPPRTEQQRMAEAFVQLDLPGPQYEEMSEDERETEHGPPKRWTTRKTKTSESTKHPATRGERNNELRKLESPIRFTTRIGRKITPGKGLPSALTSIARTTEVWEQLPFCRKGARSTSPPSSPSQDRTQHLHLQWNPDPTEENETPTGSAEIRNQVTQGSSGRWGRPGAEERIGEKETSQQENSAPRPTDPDWMASRCKWELVVEDTSKVTRAEIARYDSYCLITGNWEELSNQDLMFQTMLFDATLWGKEKATISSIRMVMAGRIFAEMVLGIIFCNLAEMLKELHFIGTRKKAPWKMIFAIMMLQPKKTEAAPFIPVTQWDVPMWTAIAGVTFIVAAVQRLRNSWAYAAVPQEAKGVIDGLATALDTCHTNMENHRGEIREKVEIYNQLVTKYNALGAQKEADDAEIAKLKHELSKAKEDLEEAVQAGDEEGKKYQEIKEELEAAQRQLGSDEDQMKAKGDDKDKMIATLQQKLREKDLNEIRKSTKVAIKAIADLARIIKELGERPQGTHSEGTHLKIIGEPPEKFDGDPKKYRTWAAAVTFNVGNQLNAFRNAQQVRIQVASLLTGTAWEKAQIDMPTIISPLSPDMEAKEEALRVVMEWLAKLYANRQEQLDAENKFAKLYQNDAPFQMFLIKFEHLYRIAQYKGPSETVTGMMARHKLHRRLKKSLMAGLMVKRAPTYEAMVMECYEIDGLTDPGTKYTHKSVKQLEEAKKYSQTQLERLKEKAKGKDCKFGNECRREKEKPGSCFWKHWGAPRLAAGGGEVLRSTLRGGEDGKTAELPSAYVPSRR